MAKTMTWTLEDHLCSSCGGRILRSVSGAGMTAGGNPVFKCADCGKATAASGPDALCWCGLSHRGNHHIKAYRCLPFSLIESRPELERMFKACGCDPKRGEVGIVLESDLRDAVKGEKMEPETINKLYLELSQITTATTAREILLQKQLAEAQGDAIPREDFAWLVVQEACETDPADEDDPECIRILRRDLKSAVLAAFLRYDAENHGIAWGAYQAGHADAKAETAAPVVGRWYFVTNDGAATLCLDEADARESAAEADIAFPRMAPHRAVQLVPADQLAAAGEPVAFAHFAENGKIRLWAPERPHDLDGKAAQPLYTADQLAAAVAAERERAALACERIAYDYNRRECLKYAELKTDAETGANECAAAIRAGANGVKSALYTNTKSPL